MVAAEEDSSDMLSYCLKGSMNELQTWGYEYLRALSGQIGKEYIQLVENGDSTDEIMKLVDYIVK